MKMSELKSNTINEFFKVQQISDYQKAFEELKNKMENKEIKRRDTKRLNGSPANDNNEEISQDRTANLAEHAAKMALNGDDHNDPNEYMCQGVSKKGCCCVLF